MNKEKFINLMTEYGDALVFIKSRDSQRVKYNTVTTNLDNPHISRKVGDRTPREMEGRVLTFAWDTDSLKQIDPMDVVKVVPLTDVVNRSVSYAKRG